jgi:hypothetical protein
MRNDEETENHRFGGVTAVIVVAMAETRVPAKPTTKVKR